MHDLHGKKQYFSKTPGTDNINAPYIPKITAINSYTESIFQNLIASTITNKTVLTPARADTGPAGPNFKAVYKLARPTVLIILPTRPIQNRRFINCTFTQ